MADLNTPENNSTGLTIMRLLAIGAAVVIIIAGMSAASSVITTVFFAFIISVSVAPLQGWLHRRGVPQWLAFVLVALAVVAFLMTLVAILIVSINQFVDALPGYRDRIAELRQSTSNFFADMGINIHDIMSIDSFQPDNINNFVVEVARSVSQAISAWGFILLLAAFMLVESIEQPAKLRRAVSEKNPMPEQLISFNRDIRSFIAINAWIGFLCALLNTVLLFLLGVDFALMWGTLSFFLSFIPMVGFVVSMIPPAFMALLEFGLLRAVIVIAGFIIINTFTDNIIYPRVMGRQLNLSALIVILSVFFWAWVLGPLGAILAVPITLMIKQLILESSDESRWLATLMEPAPKET